jgi:DNA-directed RNA polymerase specialized sigma24 family protein
VSVGQSLDADDQLNGPACRALYERKAAELILYGRALGLAHGEAEDVLQETFIALLRLREWPEQPEHYCIRTYRNRTLNHRRKLWNRLKHELESRRWFERGPAERPWERAAMRCLAGLPVEQGEVIVIKLWHLRGDWWAAGNFPEHGRRPLPLRPAETAHLSESL